MTNHRHHHLQTDSQPRLGAYGARSGLGHPPQRSAMQAPSALWRVASLMAVCAGLAACVTPPPAPAPARPAPTAPAAAPAPAPAPAPLPAPVAPPVSSAPSPGAVALREGIKAFELGEYRRAEQRLAESQKQGLNSVPEQLQAFKTQAFLFCITRRTAQCERAFESAFAVDKSFSLSPGERGHPLWGPVYTKVQAKVGAP